MRFCFAQTNAENTALFIVWSHMATDRRTSGWVVVDGDAHELTAQLNLRGDKHFDPGKHRAITISGKHRFFQESGSYVYDSIDWRECLTPHECDVILKSEYDATETFHILVNEKGRATTQQ